MDPQNSDYYVPHIHLRQDKDNEKFFFSVIVKLQKHQRLVGFLEKNPDSSIYTKLIGVSDRGGPRGTPPDTEKHYHFFLEIYGPNIPSDTSYILNDVPLVTEAYKASDDRLRKCNCTSGPGKWEEPIELHVHVFHRDTMGKVVAARKAKIKWSDADNGGTGDN